MDRRSVTLFLTFAPVVAALCGLAGYGLAPRVNAAVQSGEATRQHEQRRPGMDLWFDVDPVEVLPWSGGDVVAVHPGPDLAWVAYERRDVEGRLQLVVTRPGEALIEPARVSGRPARLSPVAPAVAMHPSGLLVFSAMDADGSRLYYQGAEAAQAASLLEREGLGNHLEQPAFSSDGSLVAFVSDGDLWTRSTATGAVTQLTETGAIEMGPVWDPSGAWIYERDGDLWRVAPSGVARGLVEAPGVQRRARAAGDSVAWFENQGALVDLVVRSQGRDRVLARSLVAPERAGPALAPDGTWAAWHDGEGDQGTYVAFGAADGGWIEGRWVDVRGVSDLAVGADAAGAVWLYGTADLARQRVPWRARVR